MFRASLWPSSGEQDMCYCTWCAALLLLDVVGSGCGALRCGVRALWRLLFDCAALWGASSVKVTVRQCCVVGREQCECYCSTVLLCGVRAVWRLLFECVVMWGASSVNDTARLCCVVGCEHWVTFTLLAPHNAAQSNSNLHTARTPQHSTVEQ